MAGVKGQGKGRPKVPGCGRKKGTTNKVTQLSLEALQPEVSSLRRQELIDNLWKLGMDGSVSATLGWLELHDDKLITEIKVKIETFDEIEDAARYIAERVFKAELPIKVGQKLLETLEKRRSFREYKFTPIFKELLENEMAKLGKKGRI